jgi:hypothetical protein
MPSDGNMIVRRRLSDDSESRGAFGVFTISRVPLDGSHASKDRQRSVMARQAARSTGGVCRDPRSPTSATLSQIADRYSPLLEIATPRDDR